MNILITGAAGFVGKNLTAALECIRDGYDSPKGYTVMSGCSLPVETPAENIQMMMDTVREVGYPVQIDRVNTLLEVCRTQKAQTT